MGALAEQSIGGRNVQGLAIPAVPIAIPQLARFRPHSRVPFIRLLAGAREQGRSLERKLLFETTLCA